MEKTRTILKDPADLSIHELAKTLPEWDRDDERFLAMARDIGERGIEYPILIDGRDKVVDGRMRWRIAKQQQLVKVECRVVADEEIVSTILACLLHRRHMTLGALAYIAFPILQVAHEEAQRRKLAMLRKGNNSPSSTQWTTGKTVDQFARSYGFSRPLFYQAGQIHEAFKKTPALKKQFEPKILEGEIGLGACLAGIAGKEATDDKSRRAGEQLELFQEAFGTLKTRFAYWGKFDPSMKEKAHKVVIETVAAMPRDLRDKFEAAIKAAKQKEQA